MAQFHPLTVTRIEKTIRNAVIVTLKPEDEEAFKFIQGQYLTFRRNFEGEELRRSYSICASEEDELLQVGIKLVDGGTFSTWANTDLSVGDTLEAMSPMGNFYAASDKDGTHYLLFAGGSGITPILSILKTGLQSDMTSRFTLVYANRNVNTIMFREELEDLKNFYLGRLNVIHILKDRSQDIDLFRGRINAEKCDRLFRSWIDISNVVMTYICGPEPMMLEIVNGLKSHGLSKDQIRFELFASGQPGRTKTRAKSTQSNVQGIPGSVTIGGQINDFTLPANTSLLNAALANNIDAPYACKAGVCSTCKAKITEGEVEMITNHALEDYEVDAGYILTCQSYPLSEKVSWNYDDVGH